MCQLYLNFKNTDLGNGGQGGPLQGDIIWVKTWIESEI